MTTLERFERELRLDPALVAQILCHFPPAPAQQEEARIRTDRASIDPAIAKALHLAADRVPIKFQLVE